MQYLTRKEFAKLKGITRQAVDDRIRRGTLHLVPVNVKQLRIAVEDTELPVVKE